MNAMEKEVCCMPLDTSLWDNKTHVWTDKLFLRGDVRQFFYRPLNMCTVVKRMLGQVEEAGALPKPKDFLMLGTDSSPWKAQVYMTVADEIFDARVEKLSGTFISKVFDGGYNEVPKWTKKMNGYLSAQHQKPLKYYYHFAYCPGCMKQYGHNYCVTFAQVK